MDYITKIKTILICNDFRPNGSLKIEPSGIAAIPHIARYSLRERSAVPQKGAIPPLGTSFHTGTSVRYPILQHLARFLAQYPIKQARKSFAILSLQVLLIDLLMGLFRGAVFHHGGVPENCPLALMGVFPP